MKELKNLPQIAVVIATKNRSSLLSNRSIPSVLIQTFQPNYILVVDDSCIDTRTENRNIVDSIQLASCKIMYLENARTEGVSGSLNTALEVLLSEPEDPAELFIAILDDDDAWAPEYLESCFSLACEQRLDMVATDLLRIENVEDEPLINNAPDLLRADDFLVGNPGIQGSNLFLLLSVLLAAGGFDEGLQSGTDRDLCIRIADLGNVRYGRNPFKLVDHYADVGRTRLSNPGSKAKVDGLTNFWQKYSGRMTSDQRGAFCDRAEMLFNWRPKDGAVLAAIEFTCADQMSYETLEYVGNSELKFLQQDIQTDPCISELAGYSFSKVKLKGRDSRAFLHAPWTAGDGREAPVHEPFSLYVGVITADPIMLAPLLDGLALLSSISSIERLNVVILDNGSPALELLEVVNNARHAGMHVALVSEEDQRRDATAGAFGKQFKIRSSGQVGIAQARTMLQRYIGKLLSTQKSSFGWILDDDMRVDDRSLAYLPWLPAFHKSNVDVLIGQYDGSSPNPPLNGIRVQLVDLFHNLVWLQRLPPDAPLPDRSAENSMFRIKYPDYYYDLSRKHTGHLEMPYWFESDVKGETVREAYSRLLVSALGVLSGNPITRPVVTEMSSEPLKTAKSSVNRGGNTFILNHRALTLTPNSIPLVGGREARRSDMVWAIVNRYYRQMTIKSVPFPVQHLGRITDKPNLNIEKVQSEIIGSALYAGLNEFLMKNQDHNLNFLAKEKVEVGELTRKHLYRRLNLLEQSFHRIAGLRGAIKGVVKPGELKDFLHYLDSWFTRKTFFQIRSGVLMQTQDDIKNFLSHLISIADDFASATVDINFIQDQL